MPEAAERRRRDNAFLIAAVALPVVVVALFLAASAVPRWTVPPPTFDLLLRTEGAYTPALQNVVTTIRVRDGQVVAEFQPAAPNSYPEKPVLYVFDHATNATAEVPLEVPASLDEGEKVRVVPVAALT